MVLPPDTGRQDGVDRGAVGSWQLSAVSYQPSVKTQLVGGGSDFRVRRHPDTSAKRVQPPLFSSVPASNRSLRKAVLTVVVITSIVGMYEGKRFRRENKGRQRGLS